MKVVVAVAMVALVMAVSACANHVRGTVSCRVCVRVCVCARDSASVGVRGAYLHRSGVRGCFGCFRLLCFFLKAFRRARREPSIFLIWRQVVFCAKYNACVRACVDVCNACVRV